MAAPKFAPAAKPADVLAELTKLLSSGKPPKVMIFMNAPSARGDEPYFFELSIKKLVAFAEARGAELNRYDGAIPGFDPSPLYAELTTPSLFAVTTVRIVKNAEAVMKGMRGAAAEEESDGEEDTEAEDGAAPKRSREAAVHPFEKATLAFLQSGPAGDIFIFTAKKLRAPFLRAAREAGAWVAEFRPLYDKPFRGGGPVESTEFGEFAQSIAKEMGLYLGAGALGAMIKKTGSQLSQFAAACEKLKSVVKQKEVTIQHVTEFIPYSRAGSPWTLAEAILSGDAPKAFIELETLANAGARDANGKIIASDGAFVMALSAIARDGRRNLQAAELLKKGKSIQDIAAMLAIPSIPAVLETFEKQVRGRPPAAHRKLLDWVTDVEISTRLRGEKLRSALERLAARARAVDPSKRPVRAS